MTLTTVKLSYEYMTIDISDMPMSGRAGVTTTRQEKASSTTVELGPSKQTVFYEKSAVFDQSNSSLITFFQVFD